MTLGEWIPIYLEAYKRDTIRPDSFYTIQLVAGKIPPEILAMELTEIRPMHLQRFVNAFGLTASKSYMDKLHVLLNAVFEAAIDNDLCTKNPAARIKYPRIHEQPREAYTMEELRIILDFAMHYDRQRIAVGIMVLLMTGIRRGELLGLKESDITDQSLTINRAVYLVHNRPCVTEHEAKTERSLRTVPLLPELAYRLQHLPHTGEYLFSTKNGTILHAGTEKQVSIYAKDYAGNRSDVVKLDNPYYKEPAPEKKPAAAAPQSPSGTQTKPPKEEKPSGSNAATPSGGGNSSGSDNSTGQQENTSAIPEGAFTPEGTGTVQDNISGTDGEKQFYTITTDAGNVFYLVIDGKREDNNVYFLNGVTESDLMALAEKNNGSMSMIPQEESCNCTEKCEAGKVNTGCPVCKNDLSGCKGKEKPTETEKPAEPEKPKKETGSVGTILFILAALLAVGGIGYYVKIVRPKQQAEDDAEFEDDGYGEGFDPDEAYGEPEYLSEDDFDDKDSK